MWLVCYSHTRSGRRLYKQQTFHSVVPSFSLGFQYPLRLISFLHFPHIILYSATFSSSNMDMRLLADFFSCTICCMVLFFRMQMFHLGLFMVLLKYNKSKHGKSRENWKFLRKIKNFLLVEPIDVKWLSLQVFCDFCKPNFSYHPTKHRPIRSWKSLQNTVQP
ncbi:hypothetical protein LCGC14_2069640 [marine sediment metagenome]|uniref:Uncharacterized protein n=1 Tax=marine sediment metagenome TaxID=412755 RepID=A0A0F9EIX6_9ZZZZ